jgi:hypothetical protein
MCARQPEGVRLVLLALAALAGAAAVEPAWAALPAGQISGEFSIVLEKALSGKSPTGQAVSSDLELEAVCRGGVWNQDVFGFARNYNLCFHSGLIAEANTAAGIRLVVKMTIEKDPTGPGEYSFRGIPAEFTIDMKREGYDLVGEFTGTFNKAPVKGKVSGSMGPYWPAAVEGHVPLRKAEHPRLFFRRGDLVALRQNAEKEEGKKIVNRLREMLPRDKNGFVSSRDSAPMYAEGIWAAGHAFLYKLTEEKAEAERAKQVAGLAMARVAGEGGGSGNASRIAGVAMAYDMCYEAWDEGFRNDVASFLLEKSLARANLADSHVDAASQSAAALAALAVMNDPVPAPVKPLSPAEAKPLAPPKDLAPPAGLPAWKFLMGRYPRAWLVAGAFLLRADEDPLSSMGGRTVARPEPGAKFACGGVQYEFRLVPAESVIYLHHLSRTLSGVTEEQRPDKVISRYAFLYTILDNEKSRCLQAWPNPTSLYEEGGSSAGGVSMWLAGRELKNGDIVRLEAGKYPFLLQVPLDQGAYASPRLVEYAEATYKAALANWQADTDAYAAAGNTAPYAEPRLRRAAHFIRRYLSLSLGEHGFPSETGGFTDCMYMLLPTAQAYRNVAGRDLAGGTGLGWVVPLQIAGKGRFWQSDWQSEYWMTLGFPNVMVEQFRPALKWAVEQEPDFATGVATHAIFALLNYPWTTTAKAPKELNLPLVIEDKRMGGYVFRSGWDDAKDFTTIVVLRKDAARSSVTAGDFAVYGRNGEMRWTGASVSPGGYLWLPGLDDYEHPNVPRVEGLMPTGGAKLTYYNVKPDGSAVLSMVQDHWVKGKAAEGRHKIEDPADQGVKALRSIAVDYSGASGTPAMIVVVDQIAGAPGKAKWVQMNFTRSRGGPGGQVSMDGRTFIYSPFQSRRAAAPTKMTMKGTFVAPAEVTLSPSGERKYPGFMKAAGGEEYFLVMTIQEGDGPEVKVDGKGLEAKAKVGGQTVAFDGEKIILGK